MAFGCDGSKINPRNVESDTTRLYDVYTSDGRLYHVTDINWIHGSSYIIANIQSTGQEVRFYSGYTIIDNIPHAPQ